MVYAMIGICVGFVIVLIVAILTNIDWYKLFYRKWGNDPMKAKVYVDYGENEMFYDGYYLYVDKDDIYYSYYIEKKSYVVKVPIAWEWVFVRGRRKILVDFANENAKPLSGRDIIPAQLGAELLNKSISGKLAVDMVNSVTSRRKIPIWQLLVFCAIVVGGFLIWRNMQSDKDVLPVTNPPVEVEPPVTLTPEDIAIIGEMGGE